MNGSDLFYLVALVVPVVVFGVRLVVDLLRDRASRAPLAPRGDERYPCAPNTLDPADWDQYWERHLDYQRRYGGVDWERSLFPNHWPFLVAQARKLGFRTVLCVGNGISVEPRVLAACGFQVVAVDFSPAAVAFATRDKLTANDVEEVFPKGVPTAQGGAVEFVCGDVRSPSCTRGPFDIVVARRMIQLFPEEERDAILDCLVQRLKPRGLLVVHNHNRHGVIDRWLAEGSFTVSDLDDDHILAAEPGTHAVWLVETSG